MLTRKHLVLADKKKNEQTSKFLYLSLGTKEKDRKQFKSTQKKKSICEKNANLGSFNSVQLKLKDQKLFKSTIK